MSNTTTAGNFTDDAGNLTLDPQTNVTLQITMSCTQACDSRTVTNIANITTPYLLPGDNAADYNASAEVVINATIYENMTIRPVTLNLKSRGVLSVFFTVDGQISTID